MPHKTLALQNGTSLDFLILMIEAIRHLGYPARFVSGEHMDSETVRSASRAIFEADLDRSRRITYAEWRERPLREKIGERLASLFGSQL